MVLFTTHVQLCDCGGKLQALKECVNRKLSGDTGSGGKISPVLKSSGCLGLEKRSPLGDLSNDAGLRASKSVQVSNYVD